MTTATTTSAKSLLSPDDHTLILIDHQPQMVFATKSIDAIALRNNAALVAHTARIFKVDTILTTVAAKSFAGPIFAELLQALPEVSPVDRSTMNCWEDANVIARVNSLANKRIVFGGLWTSVCVAGPVLAALEQGFEVYVLADACGDVSPEAHDWAMQRMLQAGARPITSLQYMLELQRDWARVNTYDAVIGLGRTLGGAYGQGLIYASAMFGASEASSAQKPAGR